MICPECGESFKLSSVLIHSIKRFVSKVFKKKKVRKESGFFPPEHANCRCFVAEIDERTKSNVASRKWNSFDGYEPEWKAAGFESEEEWLLFIKENA